LVKTFKAIKSRFNLTHIYTLNIKHMPWIIKIVMAFQSIYLLAITQIIST